MNKFIWLLEKIQDKTEDDILTFLTGVELLTYDREFLLFCDNLRDKTKEEMVQIIKGKINEG